MLKKTENLWKIVGCFRTWQNGVFGFVSLWGFNIKRFVVGVSGIVSKVLKMLVFSQFLGFSGVAYCCSSGFVRFRCFCVSCVWFSFLCCFCFCFVCFVIGFVVGCCCFVFFFVFFVVFLFCFFGGFKGQVRWPFGPPHLALNPPYFFVVFLFFLFFSFFGLFFCLFFWVFVFFGGFKGQVRWPKGPPHLALNPSYFIIFLFFCSLFLFPCLCFC